MVFDPDDFKPAVNSWFTTSDEYEGQGRAEFIDPKGSIQGATKMRFSELGEVSGEMWPDQETLETDRALRFGLDEFFSGETPRQNNGVWCLSRDLSSRNTCASLELTTPDGTFVTTDVTDYYRSSIVGHDGEQTVEKLNFEFRWPTFEVVDAEAPKYWVLPLLNFLSGCENQHPDLDHHLLRIYPTPIIPPSLSEDQKEVAIEEANRRNRLIVFEFNDSLSFVERLPDYREREDRLTNGTERSAITAVMIGEVGSRPTENSQEVEQWFPFDFISLLSLASGIEVWAPWIEFRDAGGQFVRRMHRYLDPPPFSTGHRTIKESGFPRYRDQGIGRLLTEATSSGAEEFGKPYLRVAIRHLVRSGSNSSTIDDQMTYLSRGLDGLCKRYEVDRQDLLGSLDTNKQRAVKLALKDAENHVNVIADAAKAAGDYNSSQVLSRIAGKVREAGSKEKQFGLAVTDLLEHFGLPDADIVNCHYAANPRSDGNRKWSGVLSWYRGDVIHNSYFPFSEGNYDVDDILTITRHLHDVMVRIIFKILGYSGRYRPRVLTAPLPKLVDWVKPDTPASKLGYK